MDDICFMLKTYVGDYMYYGRFIKTFLKYNIDKIPLYVVVAKAEKGLFCVDNELIHIICEEEIPGVQKTPCNRKYSLGYLNQEIVKLAFWELGLCKNYFCLDADCYFIKSFYKSDFLYVEDEPYTVFYDDAELMTNPEYYSMYGKYRNRYIRIIKDALEIDVKSNYFSCHGFAIISSAVMNNMKRNFLETRHLDYVDLVDKAPIEFTWYNYYLQKQRIIDIRIVSPLIKTFHILKQLGEEKARGMQEYDFRRCYIGIGINSNFGREKGFLSYEDISLKSIKHELKMLNGKCSGNKFMGKEKRWL